MVLSIVFLILNIAVAVLGLPHPRLLVSDCIVDNEFTLVSRDEWGAAPARGSSTLNTPVTYVVIHHSASPGACYSQDECSQAMRSMQTYHQQSNGWDDIGYNFAVGSDGLTYEGRGWERVGAHAVGYNSQSIGIVLIGDWISVVPPSEQLETTKKLIAKGVELGFIKPEYKLIGHRQVSATECPGSALFSEISTWNRFTLTL